MPPQLSHSPSPDRARAKTRLLHYLHLREAATAKVTTTGIDQTLRSQLLEAAKLVALSACIMDVEEPVCAAELAHAAWSILFIPGLVLESGDEVDRVSAILNLANGILNKGSEGEVDLDFGFEGEVGGGS